MMRWFLILLVACVALTTLQYALVVLLIVLVLTIIWGLFTQPAETFGALVFFLFASLVTNHTAATLTFLGFLGFLVVGRKATPSVGNDTDQASGSTIDHECQHNDSA